MLQKQFETYRVNVGMYPGTLETQLAIVEIHLGVLEIHPINVGAYPKALEIFLRVVGMQNLPNIVFPARFGGLRKTSFLYAKEGNAPTHTRRN